MNRELVLIVLIVLASGCLATFISGLYAQDLTFGLGANSTGHGLPLVWLTRTTIVYLGNPTHYSLNLESLLLDIAFWSLIVGVPIAVAFRRFKAK